MILLKKYIYLLSGSERRHVYRLMAIILFMSILDVVGVASIMPFMAILANPKLIEANTILAKLFQLFGYNNSRDFLFVLGLLVFCLFLLSLTFKAFTTYKLTEFALMREYSISKCLVEVYLNQPYSWFLNRSSADLGKNILSEVGTLVHGGMLPILNLIAQVFVASSILILLIFVEPTLAVSVGVVLSLTYVCVFKLMSGLLKTLGEERIAANQQRYAITAEAFGAAKEVKFGGLEESYVNRFAFPANIYATGQTTAQVIAQIPRYVLEAIAFGGMLVVVLYFMMQRDSFAEALPAISLYAFAGYRLIPSLQQIYVALTQLRFANPALDAIYNDLKSLEKYNKNENPTTVLKFENSICLEKIFYSYPLAHHPALVDVSITIPVKARVGLVGSTGSGKTTAIDLILGLLDAQAGLLLVDGVVISSENRRSWQRLIGYVPQQIYLSDNTVAANIAFGVEASDIDQLAVERAAKIANLHDFIVNDLSMGYQTPVGERGVRLSGGQRQRIGIARALYHRPQVLIFDEATSALDNLTEQVVMEAVRTLGNEITIILIAHRLSTVRECDIIFLLEKGRLKAQGTFDELIEIDGRFSAMARSH
jgi:ABC-type multidrug transport system fused ATPase/permease subunit